MASSKTNIAAIVLLVVILLAVANMVRTCKPRVGEELDVENFGGLGGYAGAKVEELLGRDKRVALIVFDDSAATIYGKDQYALTEQLKRFGYKILAEEAIPAGPLFANPDAAYQGVLPMDVFQQFAAKHAKADAIISFVGPPVILSETVPDAAEGTPPFIVANPAVAEGVIWELLESGFVTMAILPREDAAANPMALASGDPSLFDQFYQAVTHDSLSE